VNTLTEYGMIFALERAKEQSRYWAILAEVAVTAAEAATVRAVAETWDALADAVRAARSGDAPALAAAHREAAAQVATITRLHTANPTATTTDALDVATEACVVITEITATTRSTP
jgi:hypothetical protein